MPEDDIQSRLLRSSGVRSIVAEGTVAAAFSASGWDTIHSYYYRDPETAKRREFDVLARRAWRRSGDKGHAVRINLIVECKTNPGYHVVAVPPVQYIARCHLSRFWAVEPANLQLLMTEVESLGTNDQQAAELRKQLLDIALSHDGEPSGYAAPEIGQVATSFVETNVGSQRDLDASVLWRAAQVVASATTALKSQRIEEQIKELRVSALAGESAGMDPFTGVKEVLETEMRRREYYHPIVVIESPLWFLKEGELKQQEAFRLVFHDASFAGSTWVDVISAAAVPHVANRLTEHYLAALKEHGGAPAVWF